VTIFDRVCVGGIAGVIAIVPLGGALGVFDASRPPLSTPLGVPGALAIAAVTVLAMLLATAGAIRRRSRPVTFGVVVANAAATLLGTLFGFDPAVGLLIALSLAGFTGAHLAIFAYYREPGVADVLFGTLLVSGLLAALAAIVMTVTKTPSELYAFNHGRAVGTFLNPNELAAYLLVYLGAAAGLALVRRGTRAGWFALVCAGVGALALLLTFSRWGLFSAVVGVVFFAAAMRSRRALVVAVLALVVGAGVNVALGARHHDPQDTDARAVAWRAGFATFAHFPLTGVGPIAFERLYPVMRAPDAPGPNTPIAFDPHDLPLSILAETGLVGFAAFIAAVVVFARALCKLLAHASSDVRTLSLAIFAGLVALLTHSLLNSVSIAFGIIMLFTALGLAGGRGEDARHAA
jgi:O-antigen ligase